MGVPEFIGIVGLAVLFFLAYYRRRREADGVGTRRGGRDGSFASALAALEDREYEWTTAFCCPWCGEQNDPDYEFCWNCLGELSPKSGGPLGSGLR